MNKTRVLILLAAAFVMAGCSRKSELERKVDALYKRMSQPERIAQLQSMYMDALFNADGTLNADKCKELIPYGIGHFSQFCLQSPRQPNELRDRAAAIQNWLINNTPNGIPALLHEEVLSGINTLGSTIYPQQIGQACSFNTQLAELKTRQTSTQLRRMGGILALSPMVDVCRNPGFNRLEESYGEDGYLSAAMGVAFVKGLQQGDLKRGVGACTKHYLGYGGGGDAAEKELMEEILMPHEAMIRLAGSKVVMPGYHDVHGVRCVANSEILTDILRDYIGFDGMVVSDYTAIGQIPGGLSPVEQAAAAINAGNDVDFPSGDNYKLLQEALDRGLVKADVFERAVKDVLRQKFCAGLMDEDRYLYSTENIVLDTPEERQTAYDIAVQSIVLLENNGVLPLKGSENILVTGPNANSIWAMCGDYSYPAMSYFWKMEEDIDLKDQPHIVKLLDGMQGRKPAGVNIMYSRGCDWTETLETKYREDGDERAWDWKIMHRTVDSREKADAREALALARKADVIIAAMGENVMLCGENRDRMGLRLPGKQEQYVEELIKTGKPVILVMFGGRAQVVSGLAERCAAVIQAWYPGEEGGNAVADILYGNVCPSGKLSVSYPAVELNEPICYNYFSEPDPRIQWPFGYGLSYTSFFQSGMKVAQQVSIADDSFDVTLQVRNSGSVEGDEVVQLYVTPAMENGPVRLQGFCRVHLKPGETKTVQFKVYTEQLGYYSNEGNREWHIDPGKYGIALSNRSDVMLQKSIIELTGEQVVKPLREHYLSESGVLK